MLLQDELRNVTSKPYQQVVSANGEIKKEFEELVKREEERLRIEKEKEEQLSLQYIQEIIQREEACTFSQYLNVIKAKEPVVRSEQQSTTSANSNRATTSAAAAAVSVNIQSFITPLGPIVNNNPSLTIVENQTRSSISNVAVSSYATPRSNAITISNAATISNEATSSNAATISNETASSNAATMSNAAANSNATKSSAAATRLINKAKKNNILSADSVPQTINHSYSLRSATKRKV
jgi:hypothetical protein